MEMRKLERAATNIDTPDLEQQVQQLNAWFAQHARKELWGTLSLGAGSFSVGAALLVGAVYAPTLAAELAVGFVGYTMSKVFDAITDASIDEMNQQAESTLAAMLGRVEEVAAKEFGAALALPAAQRAAELARLTRSLDGITFPDDARTQNLADLHRRLLEEGFERRLHDVNIQASLDAAVARTNAVREMLIAQGEQIAQMQQDVAGLTESVQRLAENSARLERRFDAMARLIYPRLSPKEQQYALDNRLLGDLPLEEENGLRDEIARVKALQAFTKTSGEILSGAGLVAQFGDRLGIDPQLVGFAAEVNRVGTGVLTAILALPTDPLGFAGALLGTIFGVTTTGQYGANHVVTQPGLPLEHPAHLIDMALGANDHHSITQVALGPGSLDELPNHISSQQQQHCTQGESDQEEAARQLLLGQIADQAGQCCRHSRGVEHPLVFVHPGTKDIVAIPAHDPGDQQPAGQDHGGVDVEPMPGIKILYLAGHVDAIAPQHRQQQGDRDHHDVDDGGGEGQQSDHAITATGGDSIATPGGFQRRWADYTFLGDAL
ncbi:MAG TPA: hypothetical protein PKE34_05030 [Marmoricola sp.]|nr:hypothetical protein [Marmoricola sp.]